VTDLSPIGAVGALGGIATLDGIPGGARGRADRHAWAALAILVAVLVLRWVDQAVLILGMEPMRQSLHLSDTQLGLINGVGITLAAAVGSIPLAWLADRYDRRWVLAACVVFWSAATAIRGFAQAFDVVLVSTVGMSLADASLYPIAYAIIPSLFRGQQRNTANLVFYMAGSLGFALAMMLGGAIFSLLAAHDGMLPATLRGLEPWRTSSMAVGVVGALFSLLVLIIRDQRPSRSERIATTASGPNEGVRAYFQRHWRALVGVHGAFALFSAGLSPLATWLPVAISRRFGLTPAEVGAQYGSVMLAATVVGLLVSGLMNKVWGAKLGALLWARSAVYLAGFAILPLVLLTAAETRTAAFGAIAAILIAFSAFLAGIPSVLQSMVPAPLRARFAAIGVATSSLGGAATPVLVGVLSSRLWSGNSGLLLSCVVIAVPLTAAGAALMGWGLRPLGRALAEVSRDEA
jgi:predicted MFS family arabinose efflux permease